jgi:fused signal recognition particle receptor
MFGFLKKGLGGLVDALGGKKPDGKKDSAEAAEENKPGQPEPVFAKAQPAAQKQDSNSYSDIAAAAPEPRKEEASHSFAGRETAPEAKAGPVVPQAPKTVPAQPEERKAAQVLEKKPVQKQPERISLSIVTQAKAILTDEVTLGGKELDDALSRFQMDLLEGDVAYDTAEGIVAELKTALESKKVKKSRIQDEIAAVFESALARIMSENRSSGIEDAVAAAKEKPVKVMFVGPNGSGKTTTIAKIAHMLKSKGYSVVIASADTFRAAAIEQMEIHGSRLGVRVIKGKYGADPTSVAFDAVNHAKAHGADAVLIDTAGRQETNLNLVKELGKMKRIIAPDLKIYVAESIAGSSVVEQVGSFNLELGLDGVILTKLDCDPKGGTVISIARSAGVPIMYVTFGEGYGDLERFDAAKMASRIVGWSE